MIAEIALFETLPDGKLLFPSWDAAIEYIDAYIISNFRLERREDGKAALEVYLEGGGTQ